jgi:hypothetical protein
MLPRVVFCHPNIYHKPFKPLTLVMSIKAKLPLVFSSLASTSERHPLKPNTRCDLQKVFIKKFSLQLSAEHRWVGYDARCRQLLTLQTTTANVLAGVFHR